MGRNSSISWTDHTWNPWRGCHRISSGCKYCYMFRDIRRWGGDPDTVTRAAEKTFNAPLSWEEPAKVFTCSWSDFFIEEADEWREEAWAIIRSTPHLTYQILTKRPERIKECLPKPLAEKNNYPAWPLSNVWLGVTTENQTAFDVRIPLLLEVEARIYFISAEPLLGPIDMRLEKLNNHLDQVIVGGESGRGVRDMNPVWAQDIMKQCKEARIPFFFKQRGGSVKIDGEWGGDQLFGKTYKEMPCQE